MASEAPSPDAVLHLAALHVLAATGFASTSRAASLTLSSTLAQYFRVVATACTDRAVLSGRSKVAAVDIVQALEDLGVGGVRELYDWTIELDQDVSFRDAGLSGLQHDSREGLDVVRPLVELKLVPIDVFPQGVDEDDDEDDELEQVDEEPMDIDTKHFSNLDLPPSDYSWLPPLPMADIEPPTSQPSTVHASGSHQPVVPSAPMPISERYRKRMSYYASTLASSRGFVDPLIEPLPRNLPSTPSSFPALIEAYAATAKEPSIAFRQTHLRQQASELLRRFVAPSEAFSPADTLSSPLPPPRASPVVPSNSDTVPQHLTMLNPHPGMISSLVNRMQSPNLPPSLRERLLSIRPPIPLGKDKTSPGIVYGGPVRGPGLNTLARAKGKQVDEADDEMLVATWDSGPRGVEKWSRGRLATGRKVVQSGQGEARPREPPGRKPPVMTPKLESPDHSVGVSAPKLKFRLSTDGSTSPAGSASIVPVADSGNVMSTTTGRTAGTGNPSGIRLKFGKLPSTDPQTPGPGPFVSTPLPDASTPDVDSQRTLEASQRLADAQNLNTPDTTGPNGNAEPLSRPSIAQAVEDEANGSVSNGQAVGSGNGNVKIEDD